MINIENLDLEVETGIIAFKKLLIETTIKNHYVDIPIEIKQRQSKITDKYIVKRFFSIAENCPYKINYVTYESDGWDRAGKAISSWSNKYIEINEDDPITVQFETLIHEWAHHILHLRANAVKKDKLTEELEAEMVSFVVGYVIGHIDQLSHFYILGKYDEYSIPNELRLATLLKSLEKSEQRVVRVVKRILNKMGWTLGQINYHHKTEGRNLERGR